MDLLASYGIVAAAVFGVNLLPAFGPPTWAVLVLFSLHGEHAAVPLVAVGALSAAGGRLLLAVATRRLRDHVPAKQRENLTAAGELLTRRRSGTIAFLALFAISPLPSAQLFEAAGLMAVRLVPLTAAFFAGRVVSYTVYVVGASAVSETSTGQVLRSNLTSPWAIVLEVAMLALLVLLARVDWRRLLEGH
jgi:hypothetical protein